MSERKILILVGDGMADYPVESLGGVTPLEAARTPNMDILAKSGLFGLVKTVPDGMSPGSDTANLSIFGYDPAEFYTGRAPLEALNMGIELSPDDVAFRCNMVTVRGGIMEDFSAHHIDTAFSGEVIDELKKTISDPGIELYAGVSYRNIMVWRDYPHDALPVTTPPHDIQDRDVSQYLPGGPGADRLREIMERSERVIASSLKITSAREQYNGFPTSVWLWGGGWKPGMKTLGERFGLHGHTISAVDLIHGIGRAAGLTPLRVEGATGYLDTNYAGKADALIAAMPKANFILLHVESPDESGHEGNLAHKLKAIEDFDEKVVGRVMDSLSGRNDYSLLVLPDHPTPVSLKTHSREPVPFAMVKGGMSAGISPAGAGIKGFNERSAAATGVFVERGHDLLGMMLD
jgi:2,3-bisphosphoglycerate-independent phosphoglycerate mutase